MIGIGIYEEFNHSVYFPLSPASLSFNDQLMLRFGLTGFILYWVALCLALIIILNVGARAIEKAANVDLIQIIIDVRKALKERLQTDIIK